MFNPCNNDCLYTRAEGTLSIDPTKKKDELEGTGRAVTLRHAQSGEGDARIAIRRKDNPAWLQIIVLSPGDSITRITQVFPASTYIVVLECFSENCIASVTVEIH
jgi:hypothetical protein